MTAYPEKVVCQPSSSQLPTSKLEGKAQFQGYRQTVLWKLSGREGKRGKEVLFWSWEQYLGTSLTCNVLRNPCYQSVRLQLICIFLSLLLFLLPVAWAVSKKSDMARGLGEKKKNTSPLGQLSSSLCIRGLQRYMQSLTIHVIDILWVQNQVQGCHLHFYFKLKQL